MDQVSVEKRVILVLAYNLGALELAFKALAKKAKKLGVTAPTYTIGEYIPAHTVQASPEDPMANAYGEIYVPAKYEVTVEGEAPKFPGWDFVGTIEHTEHGNILRAMPEKTVPEEFRTAKPTCDHCGTVRQRSDTFLVNKDGELKRVGRACLKDYLGGKSPEHIAYLLAFEKTVRDMQDEDMRSSGGKQGLEIVDYLSNVVAVVEHYGYYISKSKCTDDNTKVPTSSEAMGNIEAKRSTDPKVRAKALDVTKAHEETAVKMLEWVQTRECKSSYDTNLKIVSMKKVLTHRDLGMVASIVPSYNYAIGMIAKKQKEASERKEAAKNMTFVGEIKKRQHFTVTVDRIMRFENEFGVAYIITMHDENHNKLVWKTSSAPILPIKKTDARGDYWQHENIAEGITYKIKGTVKKYEHYREQPQTVLQRVNFEQRVSEQNTQVQEVVQ